MARFLVLKDGHVGSLWFSQTLNSYKGVNFIFEASPCIQQMDFLFNCDRGQDMLPCECIREKCAIKTCDNRSFTKSCNLFGLSLIAPPPLTVAKWGTLGANCAVRPKIVVHLRTNLAKMAYSFYRSMPARGFLKNETALTEKQQVHLYDRRYAVQNTLQGRIVHVDPRKFVNIIKAKQIRQFRISQSALALSRKIGGNVKAVDAMYRLIYEKMQIDMYKEMSDLFHWLGVPPPRKKEKIDSRNVIKASPEDLTKVISNFRDVERVLSACGKRMLTSKSAVAFNGCRTSNCCWLSKM